MCSHLSSWRSCYLTWHLESFSSGSLCILLKWLANLWPSCLSASTVNEEELFLICFVMHCLHGRMWSNIPRTVSLMHLWRWERERDRLTETRRNTQLCPNSFCICHYQLKYARTILSSTTSPPHVMATLTQGCWNTLISFSWPEHIDSVEWD